eukprot:CAMPEP_0168490834 /NCGR_PEP_ID=MMETSP0228-20121227/69388_1 /TAXON_ID=133427 /ORGANISM="Protoceratium reticulatum, Strain CCCM 535 (=CCMP 1889)" /LENGTH=116 /DNA_ID=CAMNT_0008507559 /DNA_START=110 /DNA_END=461 /DNA_ORIENTATION=-
MKMAGTCVSSCSSSRSLRLAMALEHAFGAGLARQLPAAELGLERVPGVCVRPEQLLHEDKHCLQASVTYDPAHGELPRLQGQQQELQATTWSPMVTMTLELTGNQSMPGSQNSGML